MLPHFFNYPLESMRQPGCLDFKRGIEIVTSLNYTDIDLKNNVVGSIILNSSPTGLVKSQNLSVLYKSCYAMLSIGILGFIVWSH